MDKKAFYSLTYGVYILSTLDGDKYAGCTANSAMQITSSPQTIAVSINHDNYTWKCVKESNVFSLNVLSINSDPSLIGHFGFKSGRDIDKFDGINYSVIDDLPVLDSAMSYFICKVVDSFETSTHTVFLGEVINCSVLREDTPMTYAYYHSALKGKTPKNAPTFIAEKKEEKVKWVCSVCGYIYDGDTPFEDLPDDYVCPLCLADKSAFKKH